MKQILIVEDDSFLNKMLDYNLTADGYGVTSALNARTAADAIRQREFDLVLLDINLPDGNGFELCKLIKPQHPDTIVIFLTANDQESDQIRGYEVGAVDYITKPFLPQELLLRLGAVLRRVYSGRQEDDALSLGPATVHWGTGTVTRPEGEVSLTAKEFALLKKLADNRGNIVTIDALCAALWDGPMVGYENTLMVHIRRLREKIEADPSRPKYLLTVRGLGYRLSREGTK